MVTLLEDRTDQQDQSLLIVLLSNKKNAKPVEQNESRDRVPENVAPVIIIVCCLELTMKDSERPNNAQPHDQDNKTIHRS